MISGFRAASAFLRLVSCQVAHVRVRSGEPDGRLRSGRGRGESSWFRKPSLRAARSSDRGADLPQRVRCDPHGRRFDGTRDVPRCGARVHDRGRRYQYTSGDGRLHPRPATGFRLVSRAVPGRFRLGGIRLRRFHGSKLVKPYDAGWLRCMYRRVVRSTRSHRIGLDRSNAGKGRGAGRGSGSRFPRARRPASR